MKSLVLLLDDDAPSFCYYDVPGTTEPRRMDRETFARAVALADSRSLSLQLVCGPSGPEAWVADLVGQRPVTRYLPLGSADPRADDVLVVDASRWDARSLPLERHPICILRVAPDGLPELPDTWERLSEHVYRIVLVLLRLDEYDDERIARYGTVLTDLRQRLAAKYLRGEEAELSVLSDRLGLAEPAECGAGIEHLTVAPSGALYVCPGFAVTGADPVGDLSSGWSIPNAVLFERSRAPICAGCDAFHCRRCVYSNRRATLEVNTPAWQVCRVAHLEREASRVMLSGLHARRCMEQLAPLPPLDYDDPLDRLMQVRHAIRRGVSAVPRQAAPAPERPEERPLAPVAPSPPARNVGRVTASERDEIRDVYQRRVALEAMLSTLARMDARALAATPLYERIVSDLGTTIAAYDAWWSQIAAKYALPRERPHQTYRIEFETGDVHLT